MIAVTCPLCENVLKVPEDEIGTTGHCARCNGYISILEALEPTPRSEAPPAPLVSDPGDGAAGVALYTPKTKTTTTGEVIVESTPQVQRNCLVRILIDLNQASYMYRYKRGEFPQTKEFNDERTARDLWWEKVGAFGHVLFDSNIKRRLHNMQDAMRGLPGEPYREIRERLSSGMDSSTFLPTSEIIRIMELVKVALSRLDN